MIPDWEREGIRLYMGDCREVLKAIPDQSIDMVWTDPPYGHGNMDGDLQEARIRDKVKGARVVQADPIANDRGPEFFDLMSVFFRECSRVLVKNCCCCCCCCIAGGGPNPTFAKLSSMVDQELAFFQAVVWDKSARGNGMGWRYRRNYEFVLVSHRRGGKLLWADDSVAVPNIVRHTPVFDRIHPNEKPLGLVMDFMKWHTNDEGQTILDPFMGSGTTGVAAIRLGRKFIGVEQDEKHFETAVRRISQALDDEHDSLFPVAKDRQLSLLETEGGEA